MERELIAEYQALLGRLVGKPDDQQSGRVHTHRWTRHGHPRVRSGQGGVRRAGSRAGQNEPCGDRFSIRGFPSG